MTVWRTVWKYPIRIADRVTIEMPEGASVLHVARQGDDLCLWALVNPDPDAPKAPRTFCVAGTGHPVPFPWACKPSHIGTVLDAGGALVWHVFEVSGIEVEE